MRALVSRPPSGGVRLEDVPPPVLPPGGVRVRVEECGLCGTDLEIVAGRYGQAPPGEPYLVLGHENLGTVLERAGDATGPEVGDLVVSTVRRGCGTCAFCRVDRSDFCETGGYTERGIWKAHGFLAEEYTELASRLVVLPPSLRESGVLVEPLTVVEKALEQGEAVRLRTRPPAGAGGDPPRALVAGTGAIGMLAALLLRSRGWQVTAIDRHDSTTRAAGLLGRVGARHVDVGPDPAALAGEAFDLVVEATGSAELDVRLLDLLANNASLVLTGIPDAAAAPGDPLGARLRKLVLANQAVVGSVNANRGHFVQAVEDLQRFERSWPGLAGELVGERRPWEEFAELFAQRTAGAIKSVLSVARG